MGCCWQRRLERLGQTAPPNLRPVPVSTSLFTIRWTACTVCQLLRNILACRLLLSSTSTAVRIISTVQLQLGARRCEGVLALPCLHPCPPEEQQHSRIQGSTLQRCSWRVAERAMDRQRIPAIVALAVTGRLQLTHCLHKCGRRREALTCLTR